MKSSFKCPRFRYAVRVVSTRNAPGNMLRRRRECIACGHRFSTLEWVDQAVRRGPRRLLPPVDYQI